MSDKILQQNQKGKGDNHLVHPPSTPGCNLLDFWLSLSEAERKSTFVSTDEAAKLIGRSARTVRLWIDSGQVRAVPVGKKHEILVTSLRDYLANRVQTWEQDR